MRSRPLSVMVISCIFIATGAIGLTYHALEFTSQRPLHLELFLICCIRILAIVGGAFMLRGKNWARWLLIGWLGYHVVLSAFHSVSEVTMHSLLLVLIAYFLLRPKADQYFQPLAAADV